MLQDMSDAYMVDARKLVAGGLAPDTPAAAVLRATTGEQTVLRCRLDELAEAPVESPAVLVIGAVAALDVTALDVTATSAPTPPTFWG